MDHGPGIAASSGADVRPVLPAQGRQATEGTGMGLAICRGIVQARTGPPSGRGDPGGGASFMITLPVSPRPAPPRTPGGVAEPHAAQPVGGAVLCRPRGQGGREPARDPGPGGRRRAADRARGRGQPARPRLRGADAASGEAPWPRSRPTSRTAWCSTLACPASTAWRCCAACAPGPRSGGGADRHRQRARQGDRPRPGRRRLRDQAVRRGRADGQDPGRPAPRPGGRRRPAAGHHRRRRRHRPGRQAGDQGRDRRCA